MITLNINQATELLSYECWEHINELTALLHDMPSCSLVEQMTITSNLTGKRVFLHYSFEGSAWVLHPIEVM